MWCSTAVLLVRVPQQEECACAKNDGFKGTVTLDILKGNFSFLTFLGDVP